MSVATHRIVALCVLVTLGATSGAGAQSSRRLLDVPYVSQSADLCGGAALAMVRRYWGVPTTAGEFAHLVDRSEGGIRTSRLAEAAAAPGWHARPLAASGAGDTTIAARLDRGQPVIALILDRPGVFHYVVVVGWTDDEVVFHDPARRPLMRLPTTEFDEKWVPSGRWMLAVVPVIEHTDNRQVPGTATAAPARVLSPCLASLGCASVYRELAGLAFRQSDWPRAEHAALIATAIDAGDADAWRIAGAARYMKDDPAGALAAFNRAGEPAIDRVLVTGADRTPHPVVVNAMRLEPGRLLTARAFERAERRLAALPVTDRSDLRFVPAAGSAMTVEAAIVERDKAPSGWLPWTLMGAGALAYDRISIDLAGLAGSGETWRAAWRWTEHRPLVDVALETPSPGVLPGIVTVSGRWEEQTFAGGPTRFVSRRSRAAASLSDWATGSLAWQAGVAFDRIDDTPYAAVSGQLDRRWLDDRVSTSMAIEGWVPAGGGDRFARSDVVAAVRSSTSTTPAFQAVAGAAFASTEAPLVVWPTAGIGKNRTAALRAHAVHEDGLVTGEGFGRRIVFASAEFARPLPRIKVARTAWAVFVDAAHISGRAGRSVVHVDVGTGLRLDVPGFAGTVMMDVAYGAVDGRVRFSASIRPPWPGR